LLREMDHRVKNLFALAGGIVAIGARTAATPKDLAHSVGERLGALARAHALTISTSHGGGTSQSATLHALMNAIMSPFEGETDTGKPRITITGEDIRMAGDAVTGFALLLHEFATNAAKYGALSTPSGSVEISISQVDESVVLTWKERGGPPIDGEILHEGFGTVLARMTVTNQLGGDVVRDWQNDGLHIRLSMRRDRLQ
jgi:two-component sensor histidine kinase